MCLAFTFPSDDHSSTFAKALGDDIWTWHMNMAHADEAWQWYLNEIGHIDMRNTNYIGHIRMWHSTNEKFDIALYEILKWLLGMQMNMRHVNEYETCKWIWDMQMNMRYVNEYEIWK